MPLSTVTQIHIEARALLNDPSADIFTDAALLPLTKKVYRELQDELILNGASEVKIVQPDVQALVMVGPSSINHTISPFLLPNLIYPLEVWEKPNGADEDAWVEMEQRDWDEATYDAQDEFNIWMWRESAVQLPPVLTSREVRVKYVGSLSAIVDVNTEIPIINCQTFIAARLAALAAFVIGGNADRAEIHQADANSSLKVLISTIVKRNQNQPTRRQPFRANT